MIWKINFNSCHHQSNAVLMRQKGIPTPKTALSYSNKTHVYLRFLISFVMLRGKKKGKLQQSPSLNKRTTTKKATAETCNFCFLSCPNKDQVVIVFVMAPLKIQIWVPMESQSWDDEYISRFRDTVP